MKVRLSKLTHDRKRPTQAYVDFVIEVEGGEVQIKGCKAIVNKKGYAVFLPYSHIERIEPEKVEKKPPVPYTVVTINPPELHKEFIKLASECVVKYVEEVKRSRSSGKNEDTKAV